MIETNRTFAARRTARRRVGAWSFAGGLVGTAALVLALQWGGSPALVATVGDLPAREGQEVAAPADAEAELRFSDGTNVTLDRKSRSRLVSVDKRGARVRLESGRAKVKVVPRKGGQWLFDAGPCQVVVTGTTFDVNWSEASQRLEVDLYTGSVTVKAPPGARAGSPAEVKLKAGQRLVMDLRRGVSVTEPIGGEAPPIAVAVAPRPIAEPAGPAAAPAEEPAAPRAITPVVRRDREGRRHPQPEPRQVAGGASGQGAVSWSALVRNNDYAAVLSQARRLGIDESLSRASVADMAALADAARLTGDAALARRALLAVRTRYPDSAQAGRSAFLLGRMAEETEGDLAKALEWYTMYLAQSPNGPLAAEALGRKMTATMRLFGRSSARPLAQEYLSRFPDASYARAARALVGSAHGRD